MIKKKSDSKKLVSYSEKRLKELAKLGMSKVDPLDIRPPQILLVQKSSDLSQFVTPDGKMAKVGQYFHTGHQKIYDTFEGYFLFAAKGKYIDRRKPEEAEKEQYRALGALAEDFSLFGMTFRSSALYTLSSLFSAAASTSRPMFSFRVRMEVKELSGEKGDWHIPVLRLLYPENKPENLLLLEKMAREFDQRAEEIKDDEVDLEEPH